MPWMPGIVHDPGIHSGEHHQDPEAVIRHRTYGSYGGDYSVGKSGVGFHFYAPKTQPGVEFYDTNDVAYHAYGANGYPNQPSSIGIEVEGRDDEPFTTNQIQILGQIARWISATHKIPLVEFEPRDNGPVIYSHGPRRPLTFNGWRDHNNVDPLTEDGRPGHKNFRHTDGWFHDDWVKVVAAAGVQPPIEETDPMPWAFLQANDGTGDLFVCNGVNKLYCNSGQMYTDLQNQAQTFGQKKVDTRPTGRSVLNSIPDAPGSKSPVRP